MRPWRVADNWGRWFVWRPGVPDARAFHRGEDGAIAYFRTSEAAREVADRLNGLDAVAVAGSHERTVTP